MLKYRMFPMLNSVKVELILWGGRSQGILGEDSWKSTLFSYLQQTWANPIQK